MAAASTASTASTASSASSLLSADEWSVVASHLGPLDLGRWAMTCKVGRDAAAIVMHGADLSALAPEMNQKELCEALGLKPAEARGLPKAVEVRRNRMGRYTTHIFTSRHALPAALRLLGGWKEIDARIEKKKLSRKNRKRKRDDLGERRAAAATKRRALLDAWFAKATPVGAGIDSFDSWTASLGARGAASPSKDAVLGPFLDDAKLKAPSLKAAKEAVVEFETVQVAAAARKMELAAALAALGLSRRSDSAICSAFERGNPIAGFTTAERVAVEMALMRWLHDCTDYKKALRVEVENLCEYADGFYPGIKGEARDLVKSRAKYRPPAQWPWLAVTQRGES